MKAKLLFCLSTTCFAALACEGDTDESAANLATGTPTSGPSSTEPSATNPAVSPQTPVSSEDPGSPDGNPTDSPSMPASGGSGNADGVGGANPGDPSTPMPDGEAGGSGGSAGSDNSGPAGDAGNGGTPADGGASNAGSSGSAGTGEVIEDAERFTVNVELASDVDPSAPTTVGIVSWSVSEGSVDSAVIEFGLDAAYGMQAPVALDEPEFRTLLLGMKPAREYHFRVVADIGAQTIASGDYTLETGAPTDLIELGAFDVLDDAARERGFIVTSYWQGQSGAVPFIIDADGEIVWWYESNSNGIARARMSADGKNMWIVLASNNGGALERVTMDGLDGQSYGATVSSHDLTPVSGETMAYLEYGEADCDSIFEIDPSGTTMEVFESDDYLTSGGGLGGGGCHGNALRYSAAEDVYTFSDVNQDILVVNRQGGVEWRLSEIVPQGNSAWGGTNHGHHLLGNSMVMFANRYTDNTSAAIEYTLDGEAILTYESGAFSANLGDVQRLPSGNTLVTFSNDSLIHEIDSEGTLLLEIDGGGDALGYALWRETLYGPPPDIGD